MNYTRKSEGKVSVIQGEEAVEKIKAVLSQRTDPGLIVIARTNEKNADESIFSFRVRIKRTMVSGLSPHWAIERIKKCAFW